MSKIGYIILVRLEAFKYNDESPAGNNAVKVCRNALTHVFEDNASPEKPADECLQAKAAYGEAISKRLEEEDKKKSASPQK